MTPIPTTPTRGAVHGAPPTPPPTQARSDPASNAADKRYINSPITYIPFYEDQPRWQYYTLWKETDKAVRLYRSGLDLDQTGEKLGVFRRTVERWLCHVIRVCLAGTLNDHDIRRFVPDIRDGWVLEHYWFLIESESKRLGLAVEDSWETRLKKIRRKERGHKRIKREETPVQGAPLSPPPERPPRKIRKFNNNRTPKCERINPRPAHWTTRPRGAKLPASTTFPSHAQETVLGDFLKGMSFNGIAFERGLSRSTVQDYIFDAWLYDDGPKGILRYKYRPRPEDVGRLSDEMKGVDRYENYRQCMQKLRKMFGIEAEETEDEGTDAEETDSESEGVSEAEEDNNAEEEQEAGDEPVDEVLVKIEEPESPCAGRKRGRNGNLLSAGRL